MTASNQCIVGELYLVNTPGVKTLCVKPSWFEVTLGQVYLCVKDWGDSDYEFHQVVMREAEFEVCAGSILAKSIGVPLGFEGGQNTVEKLAARERIPHKVSAAVAEHTDEAFKQHTEEFLRTLEPGHILNLLSDDNGTSFSKGCVYVYATSGVKQNKKLKVGRVEGNKVRMESVKVSAIRNVQLESVIGKHHNKEGNPVVIGAGAFLKIPPLLSRSILNESRRLKSFEFVYIEGTLSTRVFDNFKIAMRDTSGEVQRIRIDPFVFVEDITAAFY